MSRARKSQVELQRECNRFNERCPIGTAVTVCKDSGEVVRSTTTTEAQVLGGHSAVIWVAGGRGCYLLDRVTPAEPRA